MRCSKSASRQSTAVGYRLRHFDANAWARLRATAWAAGPGSASTSSKIFQYSA
jgi:hypothetical protein